MKYSIEVRDVVIPDRPKFFRAMIRDESNADPMDIYAMALDNDSVADLMRNVAIAVGDRENYTKK